MFTSLKKELIKHRPTLRSWSIGLLSGLLISPLSYAVYSYFVSTPGNVVSLNTKNVNSVGQACDLLFSNSDLLMRYAHYTVPHTEFVNMCPECGDTQVHPETLEYGTPTDTFKTKLSDVYQDSEEIDKGLQRIIHSLLLQRQTLSRNLERLRGNNSQKQ